MLYIPKNIKSGRIILWGHGSSPGNFSYPEYKIFAQQTLTNILSYCNSLDLIAITPLLPRERERKHYPYSNFDSQIMTAEVMVEDVSEDNKFYYRPDLEIRKIIQVVHNLLAVKNISIDKKVIVGGVSAGANLANRFSMLYPDIISHSMLLLAGDFIYPAKIVSNLTLNYPFGIADLNKISGQCFSHQNFEGIKHFIFVGEKDHDSNADPLPFEVRDRIYREQLKQAIGQNQVERAKHYAQHLNNLGIFVDFDLDPSQGHSYNKNTLDRAFSLIS